MLAKSLLAYLHFLAAFGVAATLCFEWLTYRLKPTLEEARRLARADRWYGISAGVVLIVGLTRAYGFEKGFGYYLHNPYFHLKMTLFVLIGLLSIYPTRHFLGWRADLKAGRAPQVTDAQHRIVARTLSAQMLLLALLLLAASLMANGVGMA